MTVKVESFTGTANGTAFMVSEDFDYSLSGTFVATVELQRTFDGGTTWRPAKTALTAAAEGFCEHRGAPAQYRFACTAFTSGTAKAQANIQD